MSRKIWQILIPAVILGLVILLVAVMHIKSSDHRRTITCHKLEVVIKDSSSLGFVTKADVRDAIKKEYGTYIGQRIDSVNLKKIEKILNNKSAVLKSEAYTTLDGILHVRITQREPIIRFRTQEGGYYADEKGFIFPLQSRYKSQVSVVEGHIPLNVEPGYKGPAKTLKEKAWLMGVIKLMKIIKSDKSREKWVKKISVESNGDIVLWPSEGNEKFVFGRPEHVERKFGKIEDYYKYIEPAKDKGYYKYVNVKFDGQIICRRKE